MTKEEKQKLYAALAAPFPEEAIERTNGKTTGRGYDTTGIKAQYIINRLNEVVGVGGWRTHREISVKEIATSSGRKAYEAMCDLVLELGDWVDGEFVVYAEALADGGHVSTSEADARKGSFSNGLKKAASAFGCGRQAYEGTLDDDSTAIPVLAPQRHHQPAPTRPQARPAPQQTAAQPLLPPAPAPSQQPQGTEQSNRNRLTSKQLSAIWSLSRKAGYQQSDFRARVKEHFGVMPEFLDRAAASKLIDQLSKSNSNGHAPAVATAPTAPAAPVAGG